MQSYGGNNMASIYDFEVKTRKGEMVSLNEYKGKTLLIINSATGCGFTPQYDELEALYNDYKDKDFVILDFPCNQFKEQAKGTDEEIYEFCTTKFNIKFPIFSKVEVNGENKIPLFGYLEESAPYKKPKGFKNKSVMKLLEKMSNTKGTNEIRWNFTKFLVDKAGNVCDRFEPVESIKNIRKRLEEIL